MYELSIFGFKLAEVSSGEVERTRNWSTKRLYRWNSANEMEVVEYGNSTCEIGKKWNFHCGKASSGNHEYWKFYSIN